MCRVRARSSFWVALTIFVAAMQPSPLAGQDATLTGRIITTGRTIGIDIGIAAFGPDGRLVRRVVADDQGVYTLTVPAGVYDVVVSGFGYTEIRLEDLRLAAGGTLERNFELETDPFSIQGVSVTAGRRPQKSLETAAALSIVDVNDVAVRHAVTPLDHVEGIPGVDVASQGIQSEQVSTRGFNGIFGQNLTLLTDYRHASAPSLRVNLSQTIVPIPEDIEQVEVLRGPASALYGPSAADGVVHFITKSPFESQGTSIDLVGGGQSLFQGLLRHATVLNDHFAVRLSGQYFRAEEWAWTPLASELEPRDPIQERATGEIRLDARFGETEIIVNSGLFHGFRYAEQSELGISQVEDWEIGHAQVRAQRGRLWGQAYVNWNDAGQTRLLQTLVPLVDDSRLYVGQLQHGLDVGERASLTYGLDFQRTDTRTGGTISGRNEDDDLIDEVGAYGQLEASLTDRLRLVAAVRIDDHSRLSDPVWSPQVGLVFEPQEGHALRMTYNRAFAPPVPTDLLLDLPAGSFDPLPFGIRARGVPLTGFDWPRACDGNYCMASPFGTGEPEPIDAAVYWPAVVAIMGEAGIDLSGIPMPTADDVGTALRQLNASTGAFDPYSGNLSRIDPLRPNLSNTFEVGYKGLLSDRLAVGADVYFTRRRDFTSSATVVTPNAFLDTADLTAYLANYMPADQAAGLAAAIGGVDGDPALTGIPLGTVVPDDPLAGTDILLTYRNYGEIDVWGADLYAEGVLNHGFSWSANYSYISDNFFSAEEIGEAFTLNAPRHKGFLGLEYRDHLNGRWASLRGRALTGFKQIQGVWQGEVDGFYSVDAEVGFPISAATGLSISMAVRNLTKNVHQEFVGAPFIGRLFLIKARYRR